MDRLGIYKSQEHALYSESIVGDSSLYVRSNTSSTNGNYGGLSILSPSLFELGKTYTIEFYAKNLSSSQIGLHFSHHA